MNRLSIILKYSLILSVFSLYGCSLNVFSSNTQREHGFYYKVRRGDTLSLISKRFGVSVQKITDANNLRKNSTLYVATNLFIPGSNQSFKNSKEQNNSNKYKSGRLHWPVATGEISSFFGPRNGSFHDGLDIAAKEGVQIYAAHNGTVVYADNSISGYGNLLIIKGDKGFMTVYAHLNRFYKEEGDDVARGELIGEVGTTGHSSGPHLHFEVRLRSKAGNYLAVDPYPFFLKNGKISPKFRVNESLTAVFAKNSKNGTDASKY